MRNIAEPYPLCQKCRHCHLVGAIHRAGHCTPLCKGLHSNAQRRKLLQIRLEKGERCQFCKIHPWRGEGEALGIRERILDRHAHIGSTQLSLNRTICKLHHRVHYGLRMHQNLYLLRRHSKEPRSLHKLQPLIHHCSRIYGNLGAHTPIGMLKRLRLCGRLNLLIGKLSEWSSRCSKQQLLHLSKLPLQALEDCRMLRIHRQQRHPVALCSCSNNGTCGNKGLLICKGYCLAALYGRKSRLKPAEPHHCRNHNIYIICTCKIVLNGINAGKELGITVAKPLHKRGISLAVADYCTIWRKPLHLIGKHLHIIVCSKQLHLKEVSMLLYHL